MNFLVHFTANQVNLNIKEKLVAVLSCFMAILIASVVTQALVDDAIYPILIASMGASAVILFIIPSSPLAQPWPFVGGQIFSCLMGIACTQLIPDTAIASSVAVGGSVLIMLLLRCLPPPGFCHCTNPCIVR